MADQTSSCYNELARPASRLAGLRLMLMLMRYSQYSTSVASAIFNYDRSVNGCFHGEVTSLVLPITAVCTGASHLHRITKVDNSSIYNLGLAYVSSSTNSVTAQNMR